nr:hypothetical protein [Gammaproteobacteria bacterium]NIT05337.1 hypothetical protein [Gammaproteobacteria bacterium]NIT40885.1 hypothetical protein [Gammaproteobacteria bacterium]
CRPLGLLVHPFAHYLQSGRERFHPMDDAVQPVGQPGRVLDTAGHELFELRHLAHAGADGSLHLGHHGFDVERGRGRWINVYL